MTREPVDARAALIEAGAERLDSESMRWEYQRDQWRAQPAKTVVGLVLDALLSVRVPVPCTTCSGTGEVTVRFAHGDQAQDCADCWGSGTTQGAELAVVAALVEAGVLEEVGWDITTISGNRKLVLGRNGYVPVGAAHGAAVPVYRVAFVDGEQE